METTKESADQLNHDNQVEALNDLLIKNYDSEEGYKEALLESKNDRLKTYFKRQAAQRAQNINELDKAIRELNAEPATSGSTAGDLHRTWIDLKTALVGKNDEAILEECIRGDENAVKEYDEVLANQKFQDSTRKTIQYQLNGIKNTLDTIKRLEDIID